MFAQRGNVYRQVGESKQGEVEAGLAMVSDYS
jgi:hypothetical protein